MKTVLFADDNKSIREFCRASLEDEGYRVVIARDGLEAIQAYRTEAPDVAVFDIAMPRAGGLDALERIKKFSPQFPVILFTANDDAVLHDRRAALAAACIEKSYNLRDLKGVVAAALRGSASASDGASLRLGLPPEGTSTQVPVSPPSGKER